MIAITGATGNLGRLVIHGLLAAEVTPSDIVAVVRSASRATDLSDLGVNVREADYDTPDTLTAAFDGVAKVLLISGTDIGSRVPQHRNVITAALAAGVQHLLYTSILHADTSTADLAAEHKATEEAIGESGLTYTFLRNGWYYETAFGDLAATVERGSLVGASGEAEVAYATRSDFAAAAVAALIGTAHGDKVYELAGDEALTMTEIAAVISHAARTTVTYQDLGSDAYADLLGSAGLPAPVVQMIIDIALVNGRGEMASSSGDLSRLIGRGTTTAQHYFTAALS